MYKSFWKATWWNVFKEGKRAEQAWQIVKEFTSWLAKREMGKEESANKQPWNDVGVAQIASLPTSIGVTKKVCMQARGKERQAWAFSKKRHWPVGGGEPMKAARWIMAAAQGIGGILRHPLCQLEEDEE